MEKALKTNVVCLIIAACIFCISLSPADAAIVTPKIGGAQRTHIIAPMIMPEITFDGTNIAVLTEAGTPWTTLTGAARPVLTPLAQTDAFDPAAVWYSALNAKAYNWQYGWANKYINLSLIPANTKIWIEVLNQSQGLKTYDRTANSYAPIFGTNGSPNIWKWDETLSMSHNAYTLTPGIAQLSATYNVYIGDAATGAAIAGYGSQMVTFNWTSVPEPTTLAIFGTGFIYLLRKKAKA